MSPENSNELSVFPGAPRGDEEIAALPQWFVGCGCWTCTSERVSKLEFPRNFSMPFIVCPECGNKRCPKATHHDNECTNSNEPGQTGSRYGGLPEETA